MPADGCAECGFDFEVDVGTLLVRCEEFPAVAKDLLESASDSARRRPALGVWTPIEYAAHIAEALCWYAQRVERILAEDLPQLEPFDFDAAAAAGEYALRSIDRVAADVAVACQELANIAGSVGDAELRRCGVGSDGSPRSAASLLARAEHELVHHELDLRRGVRPLRDG